MKKINDINKNLNHLKTDLEDYKKKYLTEIKKNKLLTKFKLSDAEIIENAQIISKFLTAEKACQDSDVIDFCPNNGYHFNIVRDINNKLDLQITKCKKIVNSKRFIIKTNFLYSDLSENTNNIFLNQNDITVIDGDQKKTKIVNWMLKQKKQAVIEGFYLYGAFNCGKTHLVSAFCNELAIKDHTISYVMMTELISKIRTNLQAVKKTDLDLEYLKSCDVLVLDELGNESFLNYIHLDILYPILNYRLHNKKTTIFISKFSLKELYKIYKGSSKFSSYNSIETFLNRIERLACKNFFSMEQFKNDY